LKLPPLNEFTLIPPPPGPNGPKGLIRMHWSKRKQVTRRIVKEIWAQIPRPKSLYKTPITVSATRYAIRMMDEDNLVASLKIPLDVMVELGVLQGDSPKYMKLGDITQERVSKRKDEKMVIWVE